MWLYHEKQVAALCGVHCLNALLQGQYFSELDLAQIAQDLDRMEQEMLGGAQLEEGEHGNLDDSGMFSSQVLSKALELWTLQIIPYKSQQIREEPGFDPVKEAAFICNLQEHWFTLRRIDGEWWNFNSLLPAPEQLSDFYVAAYLDSLIDQGYHIYVVRGVLPAQQLPPAEQEQQGAAGRWFTPEEAREATKQAASARQRGKAHNAVETVLARAVQQGGMLTLQPRKRGAAAMDSFGAGAIVVDGDEDPELAAALAASLEDHTAAHGSAAGPSHGGCSGTALGAGASTSGSGAAFGAVGRPGGGSYGEEEDPEMAAALAASWEEHHAEGVAAAAVAGEAATGKAGASEAAAAGDGAEEKVQVPDEPEEGLAGVLMVGLRLRDGRVVTRRWRATDTVDQLRAFASLQLNGGGGGGGVVLSTQFPRRVLEGGAVALADAGVEDRSVVTVSAA